MEPSTPIPQQSLSKTILGALTNRCPRCRQGQVFQGFFRMNRRCPECDLDFEPESGYYLGAIVIGYFVGAFSVVPTVVLLFFQLKEPFPWIVIIPSLQVAIEGPLLFRYAKLGWLHLEFRLRDKFDK